MLSALQRNLSTARVERTQTDQLSVAKRHIEQTGELELQERWLSRRSQVVHLQISLLSAWPDAPQYDIERRYAEALRELEQKMLGNFRDLVRSRTSYERPAQVLDRAAGRFVKLDRAECERQIKVFGTALNAEMALHAAFSFGIPTKRAQLQDDLRDTHALIETQMNEDKVRLDDIHMPFVEETQALAHELATAGSKRERVHQQISSHEDWLTQCRNGDLKAVAHYLGQLSVAAGRAAVNRAGEDGLTAFHHACEAGDLPLASLLLRTGADLQQQTDTGRYPVHVAARIERGANTKMFLDWLALRGADIMARDPEGRGALDEAAYMGNRVAVDWLLGKGARLGDADRRGRTALHVASAAGHASLVDHLLDRRADPHMRNAAAERPLVEAVRSGHKAVVAVFEAHGYCLTQEERQQLARDGVVMPAQKVG